MVAQAPGRVPPGGPTPYQAAPRRESGSFRTLTQYSEFGVAITGQGARDGLRRFLHTLEKQGCVERPGVNGG